MCLALVPFVLFALAAIPRVWEPDLAPFAQVHAARLTEARRLAAAFGEGAWSGAAWAAASADLPSLLLAMLVGLPDPLGILVVVLGLLDGAAAVLVFLAARALLGPGPAVLAGSLYALSPWAWALARDVTVGGLTPAAAGALLAAIASVRRPSVRRVLALTLLGGLLPRIEPTAWVFALPIVATLLLARPDRRVAVVGVTTFVALAAPALVAAVDRIRPADADPAATLQRAWWLAAGVGAEHRLVGAPSPAALPEPIPSLALGCAAVLLLLGTVVTPALARASRAAVLPLLWVGLPLAVLGATAAAEVLVALLPAATVLMALPLAWRHQRAGSVVRRVGLAAAVVALTLATATVGHLAWQAAALAGAAQPYPEWVAAAEARANARPAPGLGTGAILPLRFWRAVAIAAVDAAERVGTRELLVVPAGGPIGDGASELAAVLGDRLAVRPLPPGAVTLPLEREALYLLLPGDERPGELSWPSSRLAAVALPGAAARADLVTLRARPAEHWLARATETPVRFADGSALVGVALRSDPRDGRSCLDLYWSFGAEPLGTRLAAHVAEVIARRGPAEPSVARVTLPSPEDRRADELLLRRIALDVPPDDGVAGVSLRLVSSDGTPVPGRDAGRALVGELPLVSVMAAGPTR